ncbi:acyl-CoA dehydrogenase [Pseudonocardia nantongensis]|uniref:acyl-CoA dehydrogenase n=1 Tax=Pseudonocardia nantongensis TaxID=1181885 RepID=UPI00397C7DA5
MTTVAGLPGVLAPVPYPDGPAAPPRLGPAAEFRSALADRELELPLPGDGDTVSRWAALARFGRRDLSLARLVEGHTDAVAILAEAGRAPQPHRLYGVWASRAGGGAHLAGGAGGLRLRGTVRFCSGTHLLDRALVVAGADDGTTRTVDLDLGDVHVERCAGRWRAPGMAAGDSDDVVLHDVPVPPDTVVGGPDAYTDRPGFWWGGAGVAAVWLGGAAALCDEVAAALGPDAEDPHRLAGLGTAVVAVSAADALLASTARAIDGDPGSSHRRAVQVARSAVERAGRTVLDEAPAVSGVSALAGSARFGVRLADLQIYLRQHHGGRDLADIGRALLERGGR